MPGRDTADGVERLDMALQEGFLSAGRVHAVNGLPGVTEPESEHVATGPDAVQVHPHIAEVNLSLRTGRVFLRHECLHACVPGLDRDRSPAGFDVLADRRIRNDRLVFVDQTVKNPLRGMALFAWSFQISEQHRVNGGLQGTQLRCLARRCLPFRRFRGRQCLTDRSPRDIVGPGQARMDNPRALRPGGSSRTAPLSTPSLPSTVGKTL